MLKKTFVTSFSLGLPYERHRRPQDFQLCKIDSSSPRMADLSATKLQNFRVKKKKSTIFLSNEKNLFKKSSNSPTIRALFDFGNKKTSVVSSQGRLTPTNKIMKNYTPPRCSLSRVTTRGTEYPEQ